MVVERVEAEAMVDDNITFISIPIGKVTYKVVINEIMYSPLENGPEWIELYNAGDTEIDIKGWGIADAAIIENEDDPNVITQITQILLPGDYLILTSGKREFTLDFPVSDEDGLVGVSSMPALNDGGDTILITDGVGNSVDRVSYIRDWGGGKGISLERMEAKGLSDDRGNWDSSVASRGATPLEANSRFGLGHDLKGIILKIEPKVFSPHIGESATILYDVPDQAVVTLHIFDVRGRLVLRLISEKEAGGKRGIIWDGKDRTGRLAPLGYYIVYIETTLPGNAQKMMAKETVVIGKRLN